MEKDYYSNGELRIEIEMKDGLKNGWTKEYYKNGQLKQEEYYDKGILAKVRKKYSETGVLLGEWQIDNGKENGLYKGYYPSGKMYREIEYENGKQNGVVKEYYEDGSVKTIQYFLNNCADGEMKMFHPSGKLEMYSVMKNDSTVYWNKYDEAGKNIGEWSGMVIIQTDTVVSGEKYKAQIILPFQGEGVMQVTVGDIDSTGNITKSEKELTVFKYQASYSCNTKDEGAFEIRGVVKIKEVSGRIWKCPFKTSYIVIRRHV